MITKNEKQSLEEVILIMRDISRRTKSASLPFDELANNLESISKKLNEVYYV